MVDLLSSRLVDVDARAVPCLLRKWTRMLAEAQVAPFASPPIGADAAGVLELRLSSES